MASKLEPVDREPVANSFRWLAINAFLPTGLFFVWRMVWWIVGYQTTYNTFWIVGFWIATATLCAANLTCAWLTKGAWRWVFVVSAIVSILGAVLFANPSIAHLFLQLPFLVRVIWEGNVWFLR